MKSFLNTIVAAVLLLGGINSAPALTPSDFTSEKKIGIIDSIRQTANKQIVEVTVISSGKIYRMDAPRVGHYWVGQSVAFRLSDAESAKTQMHVRHTLKNQDLAVFRFAIVPLKG